MPFQIINTLNWRHSVSREWWFVLRREREEREKWKSRKSKLVKAESFCAVNTCFWWERKRESESFLSSHNTRLFASMRRWAFLLTYSWHHHPHPNGLFARAEKSRNHSHFFFWRLAGGGCRRHGKRENWIRVDEGEREWEGVRGGG